MDLTGLDIESQPGQTYNVVCQIFLKQGLAYKKLSEQWFSVGKRLSVRNLPADQISFCRMAFATASPLDLT